MIDIQPGDVLFVWGNGPIQTLIEHVTRGPSHNAMLINESTVCEAQGGRLIGEQDLSFYLSAEYSRVEVWRDPTLTDAERTEMITYAKTFYGSPYDYLLIPLEWAHFEFGARLDWFHEHRYRICATYIEDIAYHVRRQWSKVPNPAPVDQINGGALIKIAGWRNGMWEMSRTA